MSSARITTIALILVLLSHLSWARDGCGDLAAQENLARYSLQDASQRGSPIHIAGYVTFQDNPAENIRSYWVHATAKNVSRKGISAWSASVETTGGSGPGLNLSESHDFFFTGDVIAPNEADAVPSCPSRFVLRTARGVPSIETAGGSASALTASVRINFVQFSGDSSR
jgi:hypothetical protein